MCLAIVVRIIELLGDDLAKVEVGGIVKTIDTSLVGDVAVGDYVLQHVGFALSKFNPEEAERTLARFAAEASAGQAA